MRSRAWWLTLPVLFALAALLSYGTKAQDRRTVIPKERHREAEQWAYQYWTNLFPECRRGVGSALIFNGVDDYSFLQLKDFKLRTQATFYSLSQRDIASGLEWKGVTFLEGQDASINYTKIITIKGELERSRGKWAIKFGKEYMNIRRPTCEEVSSHKPSEVTRKERAEANARLKEEEADVKREEAERIRREREMERLKIEAERVAQNSINTSYNKCGDYYYASGEQITTMGISSIYFIFELNALNWSVVVESETSAYISVEQSGGTAFFWSRNYERSDMKGPYRQTRLPNRRIPPKSHQAPLVRDGDSWRVGRGRVGTAPSCDEVYDLR